MAQEAVLAGAGAVRVEAAGERGVKRRLQRQLGQVGPLPGDGVADDEEPPALLQQEQAVQSREYNNINVPSNSKVPSLPAQ